MWTSSSRGTSRKSFGSRFFSLFLLAFSLFSASLLFGQTPSSQVPQTPPSDQYSKMTRDELLKQISEKDKLLNEWLNRAVQWQADKAQFKTDLANLQATSEKQTITIRDLMTSLQDQKQASAEQIASRDKVIKDQGIVIVATQQERDQYKTELGQQKAKGWIEDFLAFLGGFGGGFLAGHFTK